MLMNQIFASTLHGAGEFSQFRQPKKVSRWLSIWEVTLDTPERD